MDESTRPGKPVLLARLAAERSELWWPMVGLGRATLVEPAAVGEWTAKDHLAHLAAWDDRRTPQLRLLLDGRGAEIPRHNADEINAALYAERKSWSLEQAVSALCGARAGFLAALAPASGPALWTEQDTGLGPLSAADWVERRGRHDRLHGGDLRAWREAAGLRREPGPRCVLEAALVDTRAALTAWAMLVPEGERDSRPVCGQWTLRDLLGHIADWEIFCMGGLREAAAGRTPAHVDDVTAWNASHAAARAGQPWERIWADFEAARADLRSTLAGMDDQDLARPMPSSWRAEDTPYTFFYVCLDHDREHALELRTLLDV